MDRGPLDVTIEIIINVYGYNMLCSIGNIAISYVSLLVPRWQEPATEQ